MIWVVDNYDSFVYNLVHYLRIQGQEVRVLRNDHPDLANGPDAGVRALVLSPGPCTPREAGYCLALIRDQGPRLPILGVCLGHQCIGAAYGIPVVRSPRPVHGMAESVTHRGHPLFAGLEDPFPAARYHSLILPAGAAGGGPLEEIAWTSEGLVMAVAHRELPIFGVQFHPESILTPGGHQLITNFLSLSGLTPKPRHYD
jgi:anthranilate synthase/aminodeoxychorismate synthase-like glutamine amidotransferase